MTSSVTVLNSEWPTLNPGTGGGTAPGLPGLPAGVVIRCLWDGAGWAYDGARLTARPTARTDLYVELWGGPATEPDPTWMIDGDSRADLT